MVVKGRRRGGESVIGMCLIVRRLMMGVIVGWMTRGGRVGGCGCGCCLSQQRLPRCHLSPVLLLCAMHAVGV